MSVQTIPCNPNPHLIIEHAEDIDIKGWGKDEIQIKTQAGLEIPQPEGINTYRLTLPHKATLRLPYASEVSIEKAKRDAQIKAIEGKVTIEFVAGDLTIKDLGKVEVEKIGGDLIARRIRGDLRVHAVGGDVSIRDVDGEAVIENIGGDAQVKVISGGIRLTSGGDTIISFTPVPWHDYHITAGGDIRCKLSDECNATLKIASGSNRVRIKSADGNLLQPTDAHTYILGEGDASITLAAGGDITVKCSTGMESYEEGLAFELDSELADLPDNISAEIEAHLATLEGQIDEKLSQLTDVLNNTNLSPAQRDRIEERIERAKSRAKAKMAGGSQRAQSKWLRKMALINRQTRGEEKRAGHTFGLGSQKSEPVSEEEQLLILKMLEEGKITAEEAENLLSALEASGG